MAENHSIEESYNDQFDFSSIVSILWKHRKLIIFGTLGATLLSVGICLLLPKMYRSEGFYQLGNPTVKFDKGSSTAKFTENEKKLTEKDVPPTKDGSFIGIPVPLYKSSSTQFFNTNRFQRLASQDKSFKEKDLEDIMDDFRKAEDLSKWIKPVYAFSREDAREFTQSPQGESNSVLGVNLAYEAHSPESASAYVNYFGKYIRDCLLFVTLSNYVMDGYNQTIFDINRTENDIINTKFKLQQYVSKMKDIKAILSNYPESAKIENRQLVSVQEGGARFLAPVTQLVGVESTLADLRRDLAALERDKSKLTIRSDYFTRCYSELAAISEHGESLFMLLKSIKNDVFKGKDLGRDEIKEVFNTLSIDLQAFELAFFSNSRFISGPTVPVTHSWPRIGLIAIVSCITSFFLSVIAAFVLHWWQSNRNTILSNPSL